MSTKNAYGQQIQRIFNSAKRQFEDMPVSYQEIFDKYKSQLGRCALTAVKLKNDGINAARIIKIDDKKPLTNTNFQLVCKWCTKISSRTKILKRLLLSMDRNRRNRFVVVNNNQIFTFDTIHRSFLKLLINELNDNYWHIPIIITLQFDNAEIKLYDKVMSLRLDNIVTLNVTGNYSNKHLHNAASNGITSVITSGAIFSRHLTASGVYTSHVPKLHDFECPLADPGVVTKTVEAIFKLANCHDIKKLSDQHK